MVSETTALENLKYAHAIDVPLDLSSQEVHELWAEIERLFVLEKTIAELVAFKKIVNDCGFDVVTDAAILKYPERNVLTGHGASYVPVEGA